MSSLEFSQMEHFDGASRTRMVGSVVHKALSRILQSEISDPRISQTTITEVEVSRDLKHAKVFLTSADSPEALNASVEHLNRAKSYIRHCLSDQLELKFTPAIRFLVDEMPFRSNRVLQLIEETAKSNKKVQ